ncbi:MULTISPECIES: hypothetical protein [unclassified Moraxella]|uniref:hypothetical protein n=1 Tax=unclassified Moraxella TaxID=2685852 RepID=UPI003AF990B7
MLQTEQINVKVPTQLKNWAKQRATENYQSLSGFIAKVLDEEQKRFEKQLNKEGNMKAS